MNLPVPTGEVWSYQRCKLIRVLDGDTVELSIDLGFGDTRPSEKIRLWGINAPEIHGDNPGPGLAAAKALGLILADRAIVLKTIKDGREKYGRMLGLLYVGETFVNQWMVDGGYAVGYDGHGPR